MKKFFVFIALAIMCLSFNSCTQCANTNDNATFNFLWNVTAEAGGEGLLEVGFPTGEFRLEGNAATKVVSATDTVDVPNSKMLSLDDALACSNETTRLAAEQVNSFFYLKTLEGNWNVDITGYVREPNLGLYFIIDKHWPATE